VFKFSYITPDVYYIASQTFNSNIYIYGKKILIDTGHSSQYAEGIIKHVKSYDIIIDRVVLTHNHPDHSSNVDVFQKEFDAKVCVHEKLMKRYGYLKDKLLVLNEGDVLKADENLELKVIYTPGHSRGGICLYDEKNKILFSGDTIFSHGNIGRTDIGGDIHALITSIEKLLKLDIEFLCPGHMDAVKNGNKHVKMSYQFAKQASSWGM
jgi:glyoxylase-like metal-dependent hydrolase (beta-lactamase superfamily II)